MDTTLSNNAEWMKYFYRQKAKTDDLYCHIAQNDKEIDQMVYELYG